MRKIIFLLLGLGILPLLALSTSTAPVGYCLAYWMMKHAAYARGGAPQYSDRKVW
jgi:hypothetical protein